MPDVILSEVEEFAGSNDKGPWVKYTLKDTGGRAVAATFSAELGNVAKGLIGNAVTIETKPASNPKYAPTLVNIEASSNGGFTPPEPAKPAALGGDKDRLIVRQACIKAAAAAHSGSGVAAEVVVDTAAKFERWVTLGILEPFPFE